MIQTSSGYLAAVNSTSREWSARLASSGTAINAEIMSVTVHKGTRGDELNVGTMYAPYFEATIRGYSGASLLGSTLTFDLGLTVSGTTEWATIATGTVISAKAQGVDLLLTLAGPISSQGDQIIESTSTAVADVVAEIQTKLGTTVTCQDGITSLTGTLAAAMTGQTIRGALQGLAAFFGGYVTENAAGQIVIGGLSQTSTTAIRPDTYQEEPELSTGTYEITGWRVFVDSETYYLEGTEPYLDTACQFMTQTQFNAIKAGVIGQIFRGGALDQTLGNPLIEPWDVLTLSVSADAMPRLGTVTIIYDGGVSVRIQSPVTTDDEQPAQVVGPLSGQVAEAAAAADSAKTSAEEALAAAQEVNNHFYVDNAGLHVTLLESSPNTGQNILIDSDGMDIRDGTTVKAHFGENAILGEDTAVHAEVTSAGLAVRDGSTTLASFGARGARVGTEGQQSFVISPDGAEIYDSEGATTFHVGANQVSVRKRMSTLNVPLPQVVGETVTFVLDPPADYDLGNLAFYVFLGANGGSTWSTSINYYDDPAYAGPGGNQGSWEVVVTDTDPTTTVVVTCLRQDATQQADQDQCWIKYWGYGPAPTFEFGFENDVTGSGGFASGGNNTVTAAVAHAEGSFNTASGVAAHAEGAESTASALAAHAEGSNTEASAESAHAEGVGTEASGVGAHAEGNQSVASGAYSHAEGSNTEASATASHAGGVGTIAQGPYQTVVGAYNIAEGDGSSSGGNHLLFVIGNGTSTSRSNALTVSWNGIPSFRNPANTFGSVFDLIYPVGSIYMSVNSTDPGTLFGGTWVQIQDTFLLAAGTNHAAGSTGGSENAVVPYHRHSVSITSGAGTAHHHGKGTLAGSTTNNMQAGASHYMTSATAVSSLQGTINSSSSASYNFVRVSRSDTPNTGRGTPTIPAGQAVTVSGSTADESAHTHSVIGNTSYAGTSGNATGANMPPYLAVYVWQRTA